MRLRYGLRIVLLALCVLCVLPQKLVAQTVSVRNTNWFFSPYNWYIPGGFGISALSAPQREIVTNQPGAYFTLSFTNSKQAVLNLDLLGVPSSGGSTTIVVQWSVDGTLSPLHTLLMTDAQLTLATGLGDGTHTIQFWVVSSDYHQDRWSKTVTMANGLLGPPQSVRITGMALDAEATVTPAVGLRPKRILFFGDSITEGAVLTPADDATQTYAVTCARLLNAEFGVVAQPGQGWASNIAPTSGVPDFAHAYGLYYDQTPRFSLLTGASAPDYVIINMGTNDWISGTSSIKVTANTVAYLQQIRNYMPASQIFLVIPFGGFEIPALQAAYNQYTATHPSDTKLKLINLGPTSQTGIGGQVVGGTLQSADGIHPNVATHRALAYQLTAALQTAMGRNDFSSDGRSDLILQNLTTNQIADSFQNGATILNSALLSTLPDLSYRLVGSGDFNGDGHPDYVFQNTLTNQIALWYMNGTTMLGGSLITQIPGAGFNVVGIGDFNGDGKPDIVFQNQLSNQIVFWLMDGTQVIGGASLTLIPGVGYNVVGVADFDRDGQTDLLFQSAVTGGLVIWHMNGMQYLSGSPASATPPAGYHVEAVADYDGDGRPDVVLRDLLGDVVIWHLDDAKVYQADTLSSRIDTIYRIAGPR